MRRTWSCESEDRQKVRRVRAKILGASSAAFYVQENKSIIPSEKTF